MTSIIGNCGSTSAIQLQTAAQLSSQSGRLTGSSIETAGKTYDIVTTSAAVKKKIEEAGRFAGSMYATVKGSVQMKGGREVFVAKSIVTKPMIGARGEILGPRCGNGLMLNTGSETLNLEPMTDALKADFTNFRSNRPAAGTNFVGVREGNTLKVWDVAFPRGVVAPDSFN